jgi:hypothetical protein
VSLPTVTETMPILARRSARLVRCDLGLRMASVFRDTTFDKLAEASCLCDLTGHSPDGAARHLLAPDPQGRCGFYAVPPCFPVWARGDLHTVTLLVELSGRVIEHERGYRAQHQRVLELDVPRCTHCDDWALNAEFASSALRWFTCARHAGDSSDSISFEQIGCLLDLPLARP